MASTRASIASRGYWETGRMAIGHRGHGHYFSVTTERRPAMLLNLGRSLPRKTHRFGKICIVRDAERRYMTSLNYADRF